MHQCECEVEEPNWDLVIQEQLGVFLLLSQKLVGSSGSENNHIFGQQGKERRGYLIEILDEPSIVSCMSKETSNVFWFQRCRK